MVVLSLRVEFLDVLDRIGVPAAKGPMDGLVSKGCFVWRRDERLVLF